MPSIVPAALHRLLARGALHQTPLLAGHLAAVVPEPHDKPCARQAFDGGRASQAQWRTRAAACVALLGALAALAEKRGLGFKGDLGVKAGAVADAVAGRAAREVGMLGVLLLARSPNGRPKTPEQVSNRGHTSYCLNRACIHMYACNCELQPSRR